MNHDVEKIYSYNKRFDSLVKNIKNSEINPANKKLILKFGDECIANGLSMGRTIKHMHNLKLLAKRFEKSFENVTSEDTKSVMSDIERSDYSEWSKYGFRVTLKKFYKWLRKTEEAPKEVAWIKINMKKNNLKLPEELLTEDDIKKLIESTTKLRDRAFVSALYESGCRIGELLTLRIKNVTFDNYGAQLLVNGKTGPRRVRLVISVPYLTEWINKHPLKEDQNSWLWVNRSKRILKYTSVLRLLRLLKVKSGIKKPVNPHNFRHSRATYLANHLTEAQMKEFFGWVKDSEMASIYVHLSGRDVDKALLKVYGIEDNGKEEESKLKPKQCPRCEEVNPATNRYCKKCGMVLDEETIVKIVQKDMERKKADDILDRLLEDREFKKLFVKKLKGLV